MEESCQQNKYGVGLGLSICKNLIEHMAGSVNVESELNQGTKFTISFKTNCLVNDNDITLKNIRPSIEEEKSPLIPGGKSKQLKESQNPILLECPSPKKAATPSPTEMPKLLLVNDNYSILQMLQDFLEESFEVSVAENGLEAYEVVRANPRHHFDVILLDINMPIMDGF